MCDNLTLDELNRLSIIIDGEIKRLFYGEYRVIYPGIKTSFVIGYTGTKILVVDSRFSMIKILLSLKKSELLMAMKLKNASVDPVVGKTATGRDAKEAPWEFLEQTQNVKPLVTREEINA